jgi:hypothetical protein
VTGLKTSVGALQTELSGVKGERSALETGSSAMGVAVADCEYDLIAENIDISLL